jgi:hypothetical protein
MVLNPLVVSTSSTDLFTFSGSTVTGLVRAGDDEDVLSQQMLAGGYNTIEFDSSIDTLNSALFYNESCKILRDATIETQITFESNTLILRQMSLQTCVGLTQINLVANTTMSLGDSTFYGCTNFIGFGDNVSTTTISAIDSGSFFLCEKLTMDGINFQAVKNFNHVTTSTSSY